MAIDFIVVPRDTAIDTIDTPGDTMLHCFYISRVFSIE